MLPVCGVTVSEVGSVETVKADNCSHREVGGDKCDQQTTILTDSNAGIVMDLSLLHHDVLLAVADVRDVSGCKVPGLYSGHYYHQNHSEHYQVTLTLPVCEGDVAGPVVQEVIVSEQPPLARPHEHVV